MTTYNRIDNLEQNEAVMLDKYKQLTWREFLTYTTKHKVSLNRAQENEIRCYH